MVKRIDALTDAQRATFPRWAEKWVGVGHRTGLLSEAEWQVVEAAARAAYGFAGLGGPARFVRAASPVAAAIIAAGLPGGAADVEVDDTVAASVRGALRGASVRGGGAVRFAVSGAVRVAVADEVRNALRVALDDAVDFAVRGAVADAVRVEVDDAVADAVDDALRVALDDAVRDEVADAVRDAAPGAVRDALREVRDAVLSEARREFWRTRRYGNLWCDWEAWATWFTDVAHLELDPPAAARLQTMRDLTLAGPSHWRTNICVVSDRPTVMHVESRAGQTQMHCADGPAIVWSDGWALHFWHGRRVPASLIERDGWSVGEIFAERNAETRRCAIERMGWETFVAAAGLVQVGERMPDPGNPGQELALFDVPEKVYPGGFRVLLCSNATPEADGVRRRFGILVRKDVKDAVDAAVSTFPGVTREQYMSLARAT
jgi:hypothetical protein